MASYSKPKQVNGVINTMYNPDDYEISPSEVNTYLINSIELLNTKIEDMMIQINSLILRVEALEPPN